MVIIKELRKMSEKDFLPGDVWKDKNEHTSLPYLHCSLINGEKKLTWRIGIDIDKTPTSYFTFGTMYINSYDVTLIKRKMTLKKFLED